MKPSTRATSAGICAGAEMSTAVHALFIYARRLSFADETACDAWRMPPAEMSFSAPAVTPSIAAIVPKVEFTEVKRGQPYVITVTAPFAHAPAPV